MTRHGLEFEATHSRLARGGASLVNTRRLQRGLLEKNALVGPYGSAGFTEGGSGIMGIDCGATRPPSGWPLQDATNDQLRLLLAGARLI